MTIANRDLTVRLNDGEWVGPLQEFLDENQLLEVEHELILAKLESEGVFKGFEGAGGHWMLMVVPPSLAEDKQA